MENAQYILIGALWSAVFGVTYGFARAIADDFHRRRRAAAVLRGMSKSFADGGVVRQGPPLIVGERVSESTIHPRNFVRFLREFKEGAD